MYKKVYFERKLRVELIRDLKNETVDEIIDIILNKHIKTKAHTFNLSDFEEKISIENLNEAFNNLFFNNTFNLKFVTINIDQKDKEYNMHSNLYQKNIDSIKNIKVDVIAYTTRYEIEEKDDYMIKLVDKDEEIKISELRNLYPSYE